MKQVSLDSKSYLGFLTLKTCPPLQVEQTQINFLCVERKGRGKNLSNLKTSLSKWLTLLLVQSPLSSS